MFVERAEFDRVVNDLRKLVVPFGVISGSKGIICAFYGSTSEIPDGWVLCDGSNGTPDMRGYFPRGASGANSGGTGGAENHTHANHSDHAALTHTGADVSAHVGANAENGAGATITVFASAGDLSHNVTQANDHAAMSHTGHANADNLPPYREWHWIMWNPTV